jgi:hypothetical protein
MIAFDITFIDEIVFRDFRINIEILPYTSMACATNSPFLL